AWRSVASTRTTPPGWPTAASPTRWPVSRGQHPAGSSPRPVPEPAGRDRSECSRPWSGGVTAGRAELQPQALAQPPPDGPPDLPPPAEDGADAAPEVRGQPGHRPPLAAVEQEGDDLPPPVRVVRQGAGDQPLHLGRQALRVSGGVVGAGEAVLLRERDGG